MKKQQHFINFQSIFQFWNKNPNHAVRFSETAKIKMNDLNTFIRGHEYLTSAYEDPPEQEKQQLLIAVVLFY